MANKKRLSPQVIALRNLERNSNVYPKQIQPLRSYSELELEHKPEDRIGIIELFTEFAQHGQQGWLDPMKHIRELLDRIRKFAGEKRVLTSFINLLTYLAAKGVSPEAFLKYIIMERMSDDYSWRKWEAEHLPAFKIIAKVLLEIKEFPPFDQVKLGNNTISLLRDLVLVKYVGHPLAKCNIKILSDKGFLEEYQKCWGQIKLTNSAFIFFFRTNVLHFLGAMSGHIDTMHILYIIETMQTIEAAFEERLPNGLVPVNQDYFKGNLYNADFAFSLYKRHKKGYSYYSFTKELKAFLKIIKSLLNTWSGISLCNRFGNILSSRLDPNLAVAISKLIPVLTDQGGNFVYIWHTDRLINMKEENWENYITMLEVHDGCDPEYPRIFDIFSPIDVLDAEDRDEFLAVLKEENIAIETIGGAPVLKKSNKWKILLDYLSQMDPEKKQIIDNYHTSFIDGSDRNWTKENTSQFDSLGKHFHRALIKLIIPGIGQGYSTGIKSTSFKQILREFGSVNRMNYLHNIQSSCNIPLNEIKNIDFATGTQLKKNINMKLITHSWKILTEKNRIELVIQTVLGKNTQNIQKGLDVQLDKRANLLIRKPEWGPNLVKTEADIRKMLTPKEVKQLTKTESLIDRLQNQIQEQNAILDALPNLTEEERNIATILIAGRYSKTGDDLSAFVLQMLLSRYQNFPAIKTRLDFLESDIAIEFLNYTQLTYIINTYETLIYMAGIDKKFKKAYENNDKLQTILKSFIITRRNVLDEVAIDASLNKIFSISKLKSEKSRWQQILDDLSNEDSKYYKPIIVKTSKSMMDLYYGDMGGICLSGYSELIKRPSLMINRLIDAKSQQIIGMNIFILIDSQSSNSLNLKKFWIAFAFNPLSSILSHLNLNQQKLVYLTFRKQMEQIVKKTNTSLLLPGLSTDGILSNRFDFKDLIIDMERSHYFIETTNTNSVDIYYSASAYAHAALTIVPTIEKSFWADEMMKNLL